MGPYGPGPGPLWAIRALKALRVLMGPYGPGQDPYGALGARARTLMGPIMSHMMNQPYDEPAIL